MSAARPQRHDCIPSGARGKISCVNQSRSYRPSSVSLVSFSLMRATILFAGTCVIAFTSHLACGQPTPSTPLDDRHFIEYPTGDDYFMAEFDPKVKSWLVLVELGHANERVWKEYRSGNYTGPLADTEYTLVRFPNHPRALNLLGEIAKATNQTSMPIPFFERALKFYPQRAFTHAQYGHYLVEIGAVSVGISELMEALRLDPNQLQALAWLDEVLPAAQKWRVAPKDAAKADSAGTEAGRSGDSRGN